MKFIFSIMFIFTLLGLWVFIKNPGERPPQIILKPSAFESPEQLGVVLFRRFWSEVKQAPTIVFANSSLLSEPTRVWNGFLSAANDEKLDLSQKQIIYVNSTDEVWQQLQSLPEKTLFLFQSQLPLDETSTNEIEKGCIRQVKTFQMNCRALDALTNRKKSKLNTSDYLAYVERHFDRLNLVFVFEGRSSSHKSFQK